MTRYAKVQEILEQAVGGQNIHAHRNFWRNITRDVFVAKIIPTFADPVPLLIVGDGAGSNLVKALKGEPPFGDGPDDIAPRMPAGFDPLPADQIAFIETWINEGCLEDELLAVAAEPIDDVSPESDVAYWREFDDWSLFNRTPEVNTAIEAFQPEAGRYLTWVRQPSDVTEQAWITAVDGMVDSLTLLAARQAETVAKFYGDPPNLVALLDSYEAFGADTLPSDPQRPGDPHTMNGRFQWFIWAGFADACLRKDILPEFWEANQRAILVGLLNDGLFRGRFRVNGFTPDAAGKTAIREHATGLAAADLQAELRQRFRDALVP